jgi:hypothetical protein
MVLIKVSRHIFYEGPAFTSWWFRVLSFIFVRSSVLFLEPFSRPMLVLAATLRSSCGRQGFQLALLAEGLHQAVDFKTQLETNAARYFAIVVFNKRQV